MTEEVIVLNRRPDRPKKTLYFPEEDGYVFLRAEKKEAISGLCKFNFESSIVFTEEKILKKIYISPFDIDTHCYPDSWQIMLEQRKKEKPMSSLNSLEDRYEIIEEGFLRQNEEYATDYQKKHYWVIRKRIIVRKDEKVCHKKINKPDEIESALKYIDLVRKDSNKSFVEKIGRKYQEEDFTTITNVITSFNISISLESSESFTRNYELDFTYLKDGKRYVDYQDGKSNRNILLTINFDPSDRQFFEEILNSLELKIKMT